MDSSFVGQVIFNSLVAGSVNALLATGFGLAYRMERFFNFSHAGVFACSAYAFALLDGGGASLLFGVFASVLTAVSLTTLLHQVFGLVEKVPGSTRLSLLLVSFAVLIVLQNAIPLLIGSSPLSLHRASFRSSAMMLGVTIQDYQLVSIGLSVLVVTGLALILSQTRAGRVSRAVADDRELAVAMGINAPAVMLLTVSVATGVYSVGAILSSVTSQISPEMGFVALQVGLVTWVLGTRTSVLGLGIIGYALGFIQNCIVWVLPSHWQASGVLFFVLIYLIVRGEGPFEQFKSRE